MPELAYAADREKVFDPSAPPTLGHIGIAAACRLLRVSRPTLEKLIGDKDENFPVVFSIGARRYMRLAALQRWVDSKGRSA